MGRVFEKRKHKMFARFDRMAKAFSRIGKEIAIAVKQNGPDTANNPRLRMAIQNAKACNMPKDRIDAAIKRASSKEEKGYEEMLYEGYAPHGIALVVECATNNTTRTVANVRMHFTRGNGTLGKTGSLDFLFDRKGFFTIPAGNINVEELELELIDHGAEEIEKEGDEIIIQTSFTDFGRMQKGLEEKGITVISAELERIPNTLTELSPEQQKEVLELVEALEEDDDVLAVFHNMKLE